MLALSEMFGDVVKASDVASDRARALAAFVLAMPDQGAQLVELRRSQTRDWDTVLLDIRSDIVQRPIVAVREVERIAITFPARDGAPRVFALRDDFPAAAHTNDAPPGWPLVLCLHDQAWVELRLTWTPGRFIQRIRWWFEQTAQGALYGGDNPIEPLFSGAPGFLLVPPDLMLDLQLNAETRDLVVKIPGPNTDTFLLRRANVHDPIVQNMVGPNLELFAVETPVVASGRVRNAPQSLAELAELLSELGFDLLAAVRIYLRGRVDDERLGATSFGLLVAAKIGKDPEQAVGTQLRVFVSTHTLADVGVAVGVYSRTPEGRFGLLLAPDASLKGADIALLPLEVVPELDPAGAAKLSGVASDDRKVVLVGAGTIGSAIFDALFRQGFGSWTIIDDDRLRPHNLARHTLDRRALGSRKANALAAKAAAIFGLEQAPTPIAADFLDPGDHATAVRSALDQADIILDATASAAVARAITADRAVARRISCFFLGNADAVAVLAEDSARRFRLDDLEALLVTAALADGRVSRLLENVPHAIATPASCRAPTSRVPWLRAVGLSSVAAETLRQQLDDENACISIGTWKSNCGGIDGFAVPVHPFTEFPAMGWRVRVLDNLVAQLRRIRTGALPNETGGVLIGALDTWNKVVHVVSHLSDFPDSVGTATSHQRGVHGLPERLEEVRSRTNGGLAYVGEWHSHPRGASANPSGHDILQLGGIAATLAAEGRPAVSLIVAETSESVVFGEQVFV